MLIPLVALAIDRLLFWVQRQLFPYQYGGDGLLHRGVRAMLRAWEDFKSLFLQAGGRRRGVRCAGGKARRRKTPPRGGSEP